MVIQMVMYLTNNGICFRLNSTLPQCIHRSPNPQCDDIFGMNPLGGAIVWMFVSPQNSYAEILMLNLIVLGGGTLGKWLGHKGRGLMNVIHAQGGWRKLLCAFPPCRNRGKSAVCNREKRLSPELDHAGILMLFFQLPELWAVNVHYLLATQSMIFFLRQLEQTKVGSNEV